MTGKPRGTPNAVRLRSDLTRLISVRRGCAVCPLTLSRLVAYKSEWSRNRFNLLNAMHMKFPIQFRLHEVLPVVASYRIGIESRRCAAGLTVSSFNSVHRRALGHNDNQESITWSIFRPISFPHYPGECIPRGNK